jgi:hypothetical protein
VRVRIRRRAAATLLTTRPACGAVRVIVCRLRLSRRIGNAGGRPRVPVKQYRKSGSNDREEHYRLNWYDRTLLNDDV